MSRKPTGLVRRGTRAFARIRDEFIQDIPGGWEHFQCPICRTRVPHPSHIELDHYTAPIWLLDPGNRKGIDANTIRDNARLLCASCNRTGGRGRTDQHVRKLRQRKQPNRNQPLEPPQTTRGQWQLEPTTTHKKEENE